MNFNPFYRNETEVRKKDEFHTNYVTITFQDDIFSQKRGNLTKVKFILETVNYYTHACFRYQDP